MEVSGKVIVSHAVLVTRIVRMVIVRDVPGFGARRYCCRQTSVIKVRSHVEVIHLYSIDFANGAALAGETNDDEYMLNHSLIRFKQNPVV